MTMITIPKFDPVFNTVISMAGKATDYLIINPVNNFVSTSFTIEFWLLANPQNTGTILSYSLTGENSILIQNPQNINIYINTLQTTPTGVSFVDTINNLEEWHYFTLTWSATSGALILYKDGVPAYTTVLAQGTTLQPAGSLVIGQTQSSAGGGFSAPYKGKITQLRIWDNVRPPYFIMQDMNRNLFGNSNLVVWQMPWTDAQLNYITSGTYMDGTNEVSILMGTNTYPTTPPVGGKTPPVYPICTSIDGGLSWTDVASSPTILFSSVVYAGNNIVWAAGPPAYPTYLSNDNGKTWTKPNGQSYLPMISAIPGYMIGVGTANDLWATTNSGVSYTMVNGSKTFIWLSVVTATEIYAINKTFQLLYSTNGASTFTQVTTLDVPVTQVQYNNGLLVVLTKAGELVYSTDNAATWQALISNTLFSIKCFTVLDGIITVVNGANQVLLTTVNMNMVVNWQLNEGYGCYGFDYSGNNNNAHIGGCMAENDEEAWEISTKIESPQFIEGANDLIPIISARISKEIAKEAAAKTRAPIVGKALLAARETAAKKAAAPKRKVTAKRAAPAAKKVIKKTKKK